LAIFRLIGMSRWRTDDAQAQVSEPAPPEERSRRSHHYVHHARIQHRLASLDSAVSRERICAALQDINNAALTQKHFAKVHSLEAFQLASGL